MQMLRGQGGGGRRDWGTIGCLKHSSLGLDRMGDELCPSTSTLAALHLLCQPLSPQPSRIHILLVSPTRSPRLNFSKKSPKLSSHPKHTMSLAQYSAVFGRVPELYPLGTS